MASVSALFQRLDFGLLWIRLTLGGFFLYQGLTKFMAGGDTLREVGGAVSVIGIPAESGSIAPMLFGVLAATAEFLGGLLVIVGFLYRSALAALLAVMVVATILMYQTSDGDIGQFGLPMILGLIVFGMIWTGPGRFAISKE